MLKILLVIILLALIAGLIIFFGKMKKRSRSIVIGLVGCAVIAGAISYYCTKAIPSLTEQITITATGEKNEEAQSNEAGIYGFVIDGKSIEIDNPVEGQWFWKGNAYMWRNENDLRKPDGITNSITLNIPVGTERSVVFGSSKWCGISTIEYNGEISTHDYYNENSKRVYEKITPSDGFLVFANIALHILAFLLFFTVIMAAPVAYMILHDDTKVKDICIAHWDKAVYVALAFLFVYILQLNSKEGSLWGDELWIIGFIETGTFPSPTSKDALNLTNFASNGIISLWYNIMPYGQQYLMLFSQLCVAISIVISGMIGKELNGKRLGVLFASVTAFSLTVAYQGGMEFKSYALMLLFTTLMMYLFIIKQKQLGKEKISTLLLYGLSIALVIDTHAFGAVTAGLIMVCDFVLILMKKASKKALIEFVIPFLYGIVWIYGFLCTVSTSNYSYIPTPDFARLVSALQWTASSNMVILMIMVLGVVFVCVSSVRKIVTKSFTFDIDYTYLTLAAVPVLFVGAYYFYCTVITPDSPPFLDRYFMCIISFLDLLVAIGFDQIISIFENTRPRQGIQASLCIFVMLAMCITNWSRITPEEPYPATDHTQNKCYQQTAEYLMSQNDIYNKTTAVFLDHNNFAAYGMNYYLTHKGERQPINLYTSGQLPAVIDQYDTIYCIYMLKDANKTAELENFTLVDDNTQYKVTKLERNNVTS